MKNKTAKNLAMSAIIGALYYVLTLVNPLSFGFIQCRLSEALCVLTIFTPTAIPGLCIGCFFSNLMSGNIFDIVFGTLATGLGALLGYLLRKKVWLVPLPTIVCNMFIVPLLLVYAYHIEQAFWVCVLSVCVGEIVSAYGLGMIVYGILHKYCKNIFDRIK